METAQQEFDALVEKYGAEAVIEAIKSHSVKPASGGGCTKDSDCPTGYYCSGGACTLKVGG